MKAKSLSLVRYDADDAMCFDWAEPRYVDDEEGDIVQQHLYAKTIFVGGNDSIDNYIEVPEPAGQNN